MMSTGKGLRAVARWVMSKGLLSQFWLAKEQIDRVESRVINDGDGDGIGVEDGDNEDEDEEEASEQEQGEQFKPGRAQRTRCGYGGSSIQNGHTRQDNLEWICEVESTVTTKKKKQQVGLGFSSSEGLFSYSKLNRTPRLATQLGTEYKPSSSTVEVCQRKLGQAGPTFISYAVTAFRPF